MLHAVLHRKVDETVPEPQRLEDSLTSTIFGTLVMAEAWDVLATWLGVDPPAADGDSPSSVCECWFWPRMAFAEPDLVLRIGTALVVVEAKYGSDRHDLSGADEAEDDLGDQLHRQYRGIKEPLDNRFRYSDAIELAIAECHLVQVFVVDSRRQRRARRQYEQSKARLPGGSMLVFSTWQRVFRLIRALRLPLPRWAVDLRSYLAMSGLSTFEGISRRLAGPSDAVEIIGWRPRLLRGGFGQVALQLLGVPRIESITSWRPRSQPSTARYRLVRESMVDPQTLRRILDWRTADLGRRSSHQFPQQTGKKRSLQ